MVDRRQISVEENGEVLADGGEGTSDTPSDARAALENLREELLTARRAPDTDGDPLTMEIILEDGTEKTLFISGNADLFKDVTPRELAEGVGGHADSR